LEEHERKYFTKPKGDSMTTQHTPPQEDPTKKQQPGQPAKPGEHEHNEEESDPSKKTPNEAPGTQQPHRT
jgi:hypothetical protein